jgi:hypothetical protein
VKKESSGRIVKVHVKNESALVIGAFEHNEEKRKGVIECRKLREMVPMLYGWLYDVCFKLLFGNEKSGAVSAAMVR